MPHFCFDEAGTVTALSYSAHSAALELDRLWAVTEGQARFESTLQATGTSLLAICAGW